VSRCDLVEEDSEESKHDTTSPSVLQHTHQQSVIRSYSKKHHRSKPFFARTVKILVRELIRISYFFICFNVLFLDKSSSRQDNKLTAANGFANQRS
jgi:hypothetical protein